MTEDCGTNVQRSSSRQSRLERAIDCSSNPIVWETVAGLGDANPPASEHMETTEADRDSCSGESTYAVGMTYNDMDATINWEASDQLHEILEQDHRRGRTWLYRFVIPFNPKNKFYEFRGRIKTWTPATPVDGNPTADLTFYVDDNYGLVCGFLSPALEEDCFGGNC